MNSPQHTGDKAAVQTVKKSEVGLSVIQKSYSYLQRRKQDCLWSRRKCFFTKKMQGWPSNCSSGIFFNLALTLFSVSKLLEIIRRISMMKSSLKVTPSLKSTINCILRKGWEMWKNAGRSEAQKILHWEMKRKIADFLDLTRI